MASDRWALEAFATTREVGLYTVLYQLGYYPITILTTLLVQLVSPIFFQRAGDGSDASRVRQVHRVNRRLTFAVLLLTGLAVLLALAVHGYVFRWLVAPEYRPISWLLPWMVLAGGLFATGQFASLSLMSENKSVNLIGPKVVTAAVGVGLNLIGARLYGAEGVVAASILFSALYCLWLHLMLRFPKGPTAMNEVVGEV
jgi:O-antigen/teichoic acid export membrane protein